MEQLYRLKTEDLDTGWTGISQWTATKKEMQRTIRAYKYQDRTGCMDGRTHRARYTMVPAEGVA